MNDTNLDILITRVIDHRATPADWVELEGLAGHDSSVWRELAMAQKDEAAFSKTVIQTVRVAETVGLPVVIAKQSEARLRNRLRLVGAWGGWAAAALVALVFVTDRAGMMRPSSAVPGMQTAGLALPDILNQYIDQGKKDGSVVGELPDKIVLDSTKISDGRTEILYVRQIVERAQVDDLYRLTVDEAGNKKPIKIQLSVVGRNKSPM